MHQVTGATQICLVIGDPVAHTLSPHLHNAAYEACGIADKFVYVACRVAAAALPDALAGIRALGVRGVSVTIPHKSAVIPLLDEVDALARKIGAVNTIVNQNGRLFGSNTDLAGIAAPLEKRISLSGKRVALIGAGGSARAAAFAVTSRGAALKIFNRTLAHARNLAQETGAEAADLSALGELSAYDVILHSTSVGMAPHAGQSLIAAQYLRPGQLVFDFVYTPPETKLLALARERGATVIQGAEMFIAQAAAQFELYTGHKAPIEVMREALRARF